MAFSSRARIWENVQQFIPHLCFFFKVEISSCKLIPLFWPGSVHSGLASWDDCNWVFPDELHVSLFPDRFPHCLDSDIVSPIQLWWVNGVCMLRCNLPPALLAEWPGSFTCHCSNGGGGNRHGIRVSTQSWLWRTEFSYHSCLLNFKLTTFWSRVQQAMPAPHTVYSVCVQ